MLKRFGSRLIGIWPQESAEAGRGERRSSEPRSRITRFAGIYFAEFARKALIRNLSRSGALIETTLPPSIGEEVTVKIDGLAPISGKVRWRSGGQAGLQFEQPISVQEMFCCASGGAPESSAA